MTSDKKEIITLYESLKTIEDPRKQRGVRYKYCDLLLMTIYAALSGYPTASEMEYYIELHFDYFKKLLGVAIIPSHDTFSRILRITNYDKFTEVLDKWLEDNYPEICEKYGKLRVLHIDGKAVKSANEESNGQKPIYLMNAQYEGGSIKLVCVKVGEKENEISKLPEFLSLLNPKETLITIDAMGDNQTVVKAILDRKCDYLTLVKDNQKNLKNCIEEECERLKKNTHTNSNGEILSDFDELDTTETTEKGHGRIDTYKATRLSSTNFLLKLIKDGNEDNNLYNSIGSIFIYHKKSQKKEKGVYKTTETTAIIITSIENMTPKSAIELKRSHWNIEMQHWLLDVTLREDSSTARRDNAIENSSILKRFTMHIKKQSKQFDKLTLSKFNMYCNSNPESITKILFGPKVTNTENKENN